MVSPASSSMSSKCTEFRAREGVRGKEFECLNGRGDEFRAMATELCLLKSERKVRENDEGEDEVGGSAVLVASRRWALSSLWAWNVTPM